MVWCFSWNKINKRDSVLWRLVTYHVLKLVSSGLFHWLMFSEECGKERYLSENTCFPEVFTKDYIFVACSLCEPLKKHAYALLHRDTFIHLVQTAHGSHYYKQRRMLLPVLCALVLVCLYPKSESDFMSLHLHKEKEFHCRHAVFMAYCIAINNY